MQDKKLNELLEKKAILEKELQQLHKEKAILIAKRNAAECLLNILRGGK